MKNNCIDELVEHFFTDLLVHERVAHNTFVAYKSDLEQFVAYLKKQRIEISSCQKRDIVLFISLIRKNGASSRTASRKISAIKKFFLFLRQNFQFPETIKFLSLPQIEQKLPSYLTDSEIETFLNCAAQDNKSKGFRNKTILYLLYATGMRISELTILRPMDIDLKERTVRVTGKGNKERIIPLPEPICALMLEYLNIHRPALLYSCGIKKNSFQYLFFSIYKGIKPITRQALWKIFKKLLKKALIFKNVSPHSLRHSLATHLLNNGVDLRILQQILGHASINTVQVYTHLEDATLRKIYDKNHPRS